jgi:ABC-type multidrug transport system fused ATPase/permease subunit
MKMREVIQERIKGQEGGSLDGRPHWPEIGNIEFSGVSLRYRPETEEVLKQLSFKIESG